MCGCDERRALITTTNHHRLESCRGKGVRLMCIYKYTSGGPTPPMRISWWWWRVVVVVRRWGWWWWLCAAALPALPGGGGSGGGREGGGGENILIWQKHLILPNNATARLTAFFFCLFFSVCHHTCTRPDRRKNIMETTLRAPPGEDTLFNFVLKLNDTCCFTFL